MESYDIVVLGAGLSGLSFAYHYDKNIPVFEKNPKVGGLVSTINLNGYMFDHAPHLLHIRSEYVKNLIIDNLGIQLEKHVRKAKIYFDNRLIDYPFELNLYPLSEKVKQECLDGLEDIDRSDRTDEDSLRLGSYKDYAIKAFGSGIANYYLLPYNRKVWDTNPEHLTCEWMKFLPTAKVEEIIECSEHPCEKKFGYNAEFFYPSHGGIQALPEKLGKTLSSLYLNQEAKKIDIGNRIVHFSNGRRIGYKKIVSTIPLKNLIQMTIIDELKKEANNLSSTCVYCINIVVKGNVPQDIHWIYFPEPDQRFYRMSFPKNYFHGFSPENEQIISVEVASRHQDFDVEKMKSEVVENISTLKMLGINDILFIHVIKIPVAYCVYDKERTRIVNSLIQNLYNYDIVSIGRYGCWEYSSMEDAILQGKNLALELRK